MYLQLWIGWLAENRCCHWVYWLWSCELSGHLVASVDDSTVEWCIDRWWQQFVLRCVYFVCSLFVGIVIIWCHINYLIFILSYHYYYLFIFLIFSSLLDFFRLTEWINEWTFNATSYCWDLSPWALFIYFISNISYESIRFSVFSSNP